jgi:ribonuclease HI
MKPNHPHYLLFSESQLDDFDRQHRFGFWRFILQSTETNFRFEAIDREEGQSENRLALLSVIRGLEFLDQPSRVTLVTPSRYVRHGFRRGLQEWIANDWQWERFGEMIPINNADLWKRIHHAMKFHKVHCRVWRFDAPEPRESLSCSPPKFAQRKKRGRRGTIRLQPANTADEQEMAVY